MKNLFKFSERHSKLFLTVWVIKSIVLPIVSIIGFVLLMHLFDPVSAVEGYQDTQEKYEARQRQVDAIEEYAETGVATEEVPESVIASREANEQAIAQIEQAFDMMQQH